MTAVAAVPPFQPATYTVEEAAAIVGVSAWSYYQAVKRGEVPGRRVGRRIVVPRVQLDRFVNGEDWR